MFGLVLLKSLNDTWPGHRFSMLCFAVIGFVVLAPDLVLFPGHTAHCVGWHRAGFVSSKVARAFSQRLGNFLCQYWMVVVLSAPPLFWNVLTNVLRIAHMHTHTHTQIFIIYNYMYMHDVEAVFSWFSSFLSTRLQIGMLKVCSAVDIHIEI